MKNGGYTLRAVRVKWITSDDPDKSPGISQHSGDVRSLSLKLSEFNHLAQTGSWRTANLRSCRIHQRLLTVLKQSP